jgi:hypothetical protein
MMRRAKVAAVTALLAIAACSRAMPVPITDMDPGMLHVHSLDVDPADGSLYVATHTVLFRVQEGTEAERVGEKRHDLMGFTVAGPGDFIASGHPDLTDPTLQRAGAPPLLGLVQSVDQGDSWYPQSLLGEVDFHALQAAHGQVYGADSTSGRFMVSDNRLTWETRSQPSLLDFAVSPDDRNIIVGVTQDDTIRSEDGGRSWHPTSPRPPAMVGWGSRGLVGLSLGGQVLSGSGDAGMWELVGSLGGQPEALNVESDVLYAAVAERGILRSDDGGVTWVVHVPVAEDTAI